MPPHGPLAGVTVLDLTRVLAGPYCTMLLAELGARVIKVERPGSGDDARQIGPFANDDEGRSAYFGSLNRGKESIALDLRAENDRAIFELLLARADVLVENFRPGALKRLGYGWESLHERHPRLIYAAASGFGQTGPYAQRPAYDMVAQAMGGIMSLTGAEGGLPTRVGTSIGDIAAGLFTALGVTSALYARAESGNGVMIDVSMLDAQVALLENAISRYDATGDVPAPIGSRHPSIAPFGSFSASDAGFVVAVGNDGLFATLCETLGAPQLSGDERFVTNPLRVENVAELTTKLNEIFITQPVAHWLRVLEAAQVPCGPINDIAAVAGDPQIRSRNMIVEVAARSGAPSRAAGNPIKFSAHPDPAARPAPPDLDQHREALLREIGFREE